jgi:hypothetical protein
MMKKLILPLSFLIIILLFSCSSDKMKDESVINRNIQFDSN